MDPTEAYDLNEALARTYAEQRRHEEAPPPEGSGRIAWAAFCARRAGLALERALLERLSAAREPLAPGQVLGSGMMAAREEITTEALRDAMAAARALPPLPWRWGELRDGEMSRLQWLASHAGPVLEAWGGAGQGPAFAAVARLAALAPALLAEALSSRLAMTVLGRASPRTADELAPYLQSARLATQIWSEHAARTGRSTIAVSEARTLSGGQTEIVSWLAALGVLTQDLVDAQPSQAVM